MTRRLRAGLPLAPADRVPGDAPHPPRPAACRGAPLPDIAGDADLRRVLDAFYAALARDPLLAPYFAGLDMAEHLPRIVDFWSTLLFRTGRYDGNVFRPHLAMPGLTAPHFARWLETLDAAVRAAHAGPTTDRMLDLAHRIADSMQLRLGVAADGRAGTSLGGRSGGTPAGGAPGAPP